MDKIIELLMDKLAKGELGLGKFVGILVVAALIAVITGFFKSIRFVQTGEQALKMRFGQVVTHRRGDKKGQAKIMEPGMILLIPFIDTLKRHPVRDQMMQLEPQRITLADDTTWVMKGVIFYRISSIYHALFEVNDVDNTMRTFAETRLREFLQKLPSYKNLRDVEAIADKLLEELREQGTKWGVKVNNFALTDSAPDASIIEGLASHASVKLKYEAVAQFGFKPEENPALTGALLGSVQPVQHINTAPTVKITKVSRVHLDGSEGTGHRFE